MKELYLANYCTYGRARACGMVQSPCRRLNLSLHKVDSHIKKVGQMVLELDLKPNVETKPEPEATKVEGKSLADELQNINQLQKDGVLSEEDFKQLKDKLIAAS
jgi:hypothetical protein